MGLLLLGIFFVLIFLNVPIAVALGLSSMIVLFFSASFGIPLPLEMFPNLMYSGVGKFALLAIPYFIMAGLVMEYAGISKRLIRFASAFVGHTKGGLIIVVVAVSCFFAAISGSGPATVAALGAILIPAMVSAGYNRGLSTALMSSSGAIGIIIPPSILYVVYASISDVSVAKIFAGGFIPGILLGASFVVAAMISSRHDKIVRPPKASAKERWLAFKDAFWGLLTPVVILGGIYGGIFTPTESAGIAIIYALIVGVFIYKEINFKNVGKLFVDAAVMSAQVMFIVACATVFAWLLTTSHMATDAAEFLLTISGNNKIVLLIIINIIFLIAGCLLDANSACYILVPILLPLCIKMGIDPVHFGVFMTVNLAIGLVTPPVGINLYVGASVLKIPVMEVITKVIPFVLAGIVALAFITYIPQLTMFTANLLTK